MVNQLRIESSMMVRQISLCDQMGIPTQNGADRWERTSGTQNQRHYGTQLHSGHLVRPRYHKRQRYQLWRRRLINEALLLRHPFEPMLVTV